MNKAIWKYKLICQICNRLFNSDAKAVKHCNSCTYKLIDLTCEERGVGKYGR